jgi:hypothetical protein
LRLALVNSAPGFSDDVYRYRWEGHAAATGNPYLMRPDRDLRDEVTARVPVPESPSGYGPLMVWLEGVNYRVAAWWTADPHAQARVMKWAPVLFELATLWLMAGFPVRQLVFYAWSPVVLVETWWNGHNDAVAVFFVVAAVRLAVAERGSAAFAALALGTAAKWWPAILFPLLLVRLRTWRAAVAVPVFAATLVPFAGTDWGELWTQARYMSGYLGGWRNNDSLFGAIFWAAGGDVYGAKYASFAIVAVLTLWFSRWDLTRGAMATLMALLLVSANVHPWYLVWLVPFLVWHSWPPVLVWMGLMPLAYRVLADWVFLGVWEGSTGERWWIYGPVLAACFYWIFTPSGRLGARCAVGLKSSSTEPRKERSE